MLRLRRATTVSSLALATLLSSGCKPKPEDGPVQAPSTASDGVSTAPVDAGPRPPVELIHIEGHVHELDAMLDGANAFLASWTDEGGNWKAQVQAILLSTGFGPGALDALALDGQFAGSFAYPHPGQAHAVPGDATLAVSIPTKDNAALLEALPAAYRPQPMGEGMWELLQGDLRILMRETSGSMQVGFAPDQLDHAGELAAKAPSGRRLQFKAWNIPKDDIDANTVLRGRGGGDFADRLGEVIQETTSVTGELEFGTDRDLQALATAQAPFDQLPLQIYGAPTTAPSEVASRLPADAAMVAYMSWGDPAALHRGVDRELNAGSVPPPFDGVVEDVAQGIHTVLDGIQSEVVMAIYLDEKGRATVIVGAKIKDEAKTTKGIRTILSAAERAISSHIALVGDDPEYKYRVDYKEDGVSLPGGKADQLTVTVPKYMQDRTKVGAALLGAKKPKIEVVTQVRDGYGFVAIGQGSRTMMGKVARALKSPPKENLELDGGLPLAREASGGCALCVAFDVRQSARLATRFAGAGASDADEERYTKDLMAAADALTIDASVTFGAAVEGQTGTLAVGLPKSLLFADRAQTKALLDLYGKFVNPPPASPASSKSR